ncbi:MAG: phospholipase, partial [Mucilaginibacter sp.]
MKKSILPILLFICFLAPSLTKAQSAATYDRGSFITKGDTLPYRILFPQDFDPLKKYPLIIVLHGAGERGNDNQAQLLWGSKLFLKDTIRERYPA